MDAQNVVVQGFRMYTQYTSRSGIMVQSFYVSAGDYVKDI